MPRYYRFSCFLALCLLAATTTAQAAQAANAPAAVIHSPQDLGSFEIAKAPSQLPYQVALLPFADAEQVSRIIASNLNRSELKSTSQHLPPAASMADFNSNYRTWQQTGLRYLVIGALQPADSTQADSDKIAIAFSVIDIATGSAINGVQIQLADNSEQGLRHSAHVISDRIYELMTGTPGDFSGRIAYVEETGDPRHKTSALKIMDADGQNVHTLLTVQGSIFSPTWSKDGRQLAYSVQRPNSLPVIYVYDTNSHAARLVTPFKGNNLGASFSPDGTVLLFSGSHENNDPAIYELHLPSGQVQKLTHLAGAENSPSFAPDGRSFVFTADNGTRTPKLYRYNVGTKQVLPLAHGMASRPNLSADGQKIAYVAGSTLVVQDSQGRIQPIAPSNQHESASFSPNGKRLVYATPQGMVFKNLITGESFNKTSQGRIREPAWSAGQR